MISIIGMMPHMDVEDFCILLGMILVILATAEAYRINLHRKVQGLKRASSKGESEFIDWIENNSWHLIKKESDDYKPDDLMEVVHKHSEFLRGIVARNDKDFSGRRRLIVVIPAILLIILGVLFLISGVSGNNSSHILIACLDFLVVLLGVRLFTIFGSMGKEAQEALGIYGRMSNRLSK